MIVLVLNCWSYSLRYHLFDWNRRLLLARGSVERIALGEARIYHFVHGKEPVVDFFDAPGHREAVSAVLDLLTRRDTGVIPSVRSIGAVAHRVVHGGEAFHSSTLIDDRVLEAIRDARDLAPFHNDPNVAGIEAALELIPAIPHVAIFDTAFHQTMPDYAYIYPLPYEWYTNYGVRRYGFHGSSHLYLSRRGAALLGKDPAESSFVTIHLERGSSLCAVKNGRSVDTSMGLTPLEGPLMESRCGDIDPGIIPFMINEENLSAREMERILNYKSGITAVTGGQIDRRRMLECCAQGEPDCLRALEMESYRLKKYIGSYITAAGLPDAVVFGGATGDREWMARERVLEGLEQFGILFDREANRRVGNGEADISAPGGRVRVLVVPSREELVMAEDTAAIVAGTYRGTEEHRYVFAFPGFNPDPASSKF